MSAAIVNSQNGPYFDHWSSILLDCIKNKKVKRIKNLLDALMNGVNMYNVDDCWFEYLDSNPPKTLDSESRSEMIYTILYWIYLLVNEEIKVIIFYLVLLGFFYLKITCAYLKFIIM